MGARHAASSLFQAEGVLLAGQHKGSGGLGWENQNDEITSICTSETSGPVAAGGLTSARRFFSQEMAKAREG